MSLKPFCRWPRCLEAGGSWFSKLVLMLPLSASCAGSVTLHWNPSPSPDVTGYRVYYGRISGVYPNTLAVGNNTKVTISNLVAGSTYYFAATSHDAANHESGFSNEAVYTVPGDGSGQPVALGRPSFSNGQFSFTVSGSNGVQCVVESSSNMVDWIPQTTNQAPFTFVEINASQFQKRFYRGTYLF